MTPDGEESRQALATLVRKEALTKVGSPVWGESSTVEYQ
jgi:hypothetical protein